MSDGSEASGGSIMKTRRWREARMGEDERRDFRKVGVFLGKRVKVRCEGNEEEGDI